MPLYLAYCPDKEGNFAGRMQERQAHVSASAAGKKAGTTVFGRAFVDDAHSHHAAERLTPQAQHDGMAGSVMIYRYPTIEECWARIRGDAYWLQGVWDRDRVVVREIIGAEGDDALRLVVGA
ncbi:hypothetical protein Q8F55_008593 [Vanrija albida]|uniref:YCII-related domain-containing protein n=1 Tax=Vanrija albida TaxID=181172 RepID=A0ABR3PR96_9TREE